MRFHEDPVDAGGYAGPGQGFYQLRLTAGNAARLIGLLKAVGYIEDNRISPFLHHRDRSEINNQVSITET